jgi:hypothetical protein
VESWNRFTTTATTTDYEEMASQSFTVVVAVVVHRTIRAVMRHGGLPEEFPTSKRVPRNGVVVDSAFLLRITVSSCAAACYKDSSARTNGCLHAKRRVRACSRRDHRPR